MLGKGGVKVSPQQREYVDNRYLDQLNAHRASSTTWFFGGGGAGVGVSTPFFQFVPSTPALQYIPTEQIYSREKVEPKLPTAEEALAEMSRMVDESEKRVQALCGITVYQKGISEAEAAKIAYEQECRIADRWKDVRRHEARVAELKREVRAEMEAEAKSSEHLARAFDQNLHLTMRERLLAIPTRYYLKLDV